MVVDNRGRQSVRTETWVATELLYFLKVILNIFLFKVFSAVRTVLYSVLSYLLLLEPSYQAVLMENVVAVRNSHAL